MAARQFRRAPSATPADLRRLRDNADDRRDWIAVLVAITQGPVWDGRRHRSSASLPRPGLTAPVAVEYRVDHPIVDPALITEPALAAAHLGALVLGINRSRSMCWCPLGRTARVGRAGFRAVGHGRALVLLPGTVDRACELGDAVAS